MDPHVAGSSPVTLPTSLEKNPVKVLVASKAVSEYQDKAAITVVL
ncbi:hypothetical protein HG1285_08311 [Hydrogenivirga sp. 128-5-R1-1]|nr:hypothetical protein HG1285_08311 [Hydrogenivirga sp. 128-5-R1-1]